ncbi:MAG TPA: UDP-N-acetylmuramoyl-L-alanyl-D-glutamate--2,6-diaminopimelate ligase, partial [Chromatiaceae bacterium]|nr:UDP-N-acetylmuramoyl-L-alanyl-D-glutamate--2,6-diaminopimelate ligase [Chromatiaceae bacterium]
MLGVTGTNGKTSVSLFLSQALPKVWRCAITGTLGNGFPGALEPSTHTTPDAVQAQRILDSLERSGARAVAMEVSSHALDQHRLEAVPFHTAVFTNLSRDHLDYHGSMSNYARAKQRLFERPELELAVINSDDGMGGELVRKLAGRVRRVACHRGGKTLGAEEFVRLERLYPSDRGLEMEVTTSWGEAVVRSRLVGDFNVTNLQLVLGVMLGWGVPLEEAVKHLEQLQTVPGRMEKFGGGDHPLVVVDYAHTPDALQRALTSLRAHTSGRLWCVFGCGGDRDRGKRPQMGRIAEALADEVIVTDDNPRHEPSTSIIADILEGMTSPGTAHVIPDRAWAIATALAESRPGDTVLVAGKGHETWQQVGDLRLPFSDVE